MWQFMFFECMPIQRLSNYIYLIQRLKRSVPLGNLTSTMNHHHILQLQQRAQRLMEVSSEQSEQGIDNINDKLKQIIGRLHATPNLSSSEPQALSEYMDLLQQNKVLKNDLEKQTNRNERMSEQIERLNIKNKELVEAVGHRHTNEIVKDQLRHQNHHQQEIKGLQESLYQSESKCDHLLKMYITQKQKCHKLSNFIRQKLPTMQEEIAVLNGKLETKLQQHYLSDF